MEETTASLHEDDINIGERFSADELLLLRVGIEYVVCTFTIRFLILLVIFFPLKPIKRKREFIMNHLRSQDLFGGVNIRNEPFSWRRDFRLIKSVCLPDPSFDGISVNRPLEISCGYGNQYLVKGIGRVGMR